MSSSGENLLVVNDKNLSLSINQQEIPQSLKEAIELAGCVDRRIEDCAVEWQANISQAQWRILESKSEKKSWEESVLARTYFTDKVLDYAFQGLLAHNKKFADHLTNFVALLRGENPTFAPKRTSDAENQCSDILLREESGVNKLRPLPDHLELSLRDNTKKIPDNAQQSFTDLIKAKIDFDTKFLGFEATLNGAARNSSDPSMSICQLCSDVLETTVNKSKIVQSVGAGGRKTRRSNKIKQKRLAKRKGRGRKRSFSLAQFSDQSPLTSDRNYKTPLLQ